MRDRVAPALYSLAYQAEGPGLVAHRLLEAGCLGDHSADGDPVAVYLARSGAHQPHVAYANGWVTFGHGVDRFLMDLPAAVAEFCSEFEAGRWKALDRYIAEKMRGGARRASS